MAASAASPLPDRELKEATWSPACVASPADERNRNAPYQTSSGHPARGPFEWDRRLWVMDSLLHDCPEDTYDPGGCGDRNNRSALVRVRPWRSSRSSL